MPDRPEITPEHPPETPAPESAPMPSYPYVLLSAAVSLDGYLDDTTPERLLLSSPSDFDRVDKVRASVDAIAAMVQ